MFDMFRGGKPDPMTLMAVNYEERKNELNRIVEFIQDHYSGSGAIDIEDLAAEMGCNLDLDDSDIAYIERQLR